MENTEGNLGLFNKYFSDGKPMLYHVACLKIMLAQEQFAYDISFCTKFNLSFYKSKVTLKKKKHKEYIHEKKNLSKNEILKCNL